MTGQKIAAQVHMRARCLTPMWQPLSLSRAVACVIATTVACASSPTANNTNDSVKVVDTVAAPVVPYVWPDRSAIVPGMTRQLRLETFTVSSGLYAAKGTASWSTSDASVATVDQTGLVTATTTGHATITATYNGNAINADVLVFAYPAPPRFASVSLGTTHACGVTMDHAAYCWGSNDHNQLGTTAAIDDCESVSANGVPMIWARSSYPCSAVPHQVELPETVVDVQAGVLGACAITTTNAVYCWGTGNGLTSSVPQRLAGRNFRAISVGAAQTCGISVDSLAYCWGTGFLGGLSPGPTFSPSAVVNSRPWSAISSRTDASCALDATGLPYCWGLAPVAATLGEAQCPILACTPFPTAVPASSGSTSARFTQIVATGSNNCALTADGKLYCWGGDETRAIGIEPATSQPANGLVSITAGIDQGPAHTRPICGLASDGSSYCWYYSRSARADSAFALAPYTVGVSLRSIVHRDTGGSSCGLGVDGFAYCWGTGFYGSAILGDGKFGEYLPALSPAKVIGQ